MTDDEQVRSLLTLAAELPDDIQLPVDGLVARGRRRRRTRAVGSVLTVVVVTAAAFTLPPIIRSLGPGRSHPISAPTPSSLFPAHPVREPAGPTAAQLSRFRWSALSPSPLGSVSQPVVAWTGKDLIELSGPAQGASSNEGAVFNPETHTWRAIAVPNIVDLNGALTVWTGRQLFVTNGHIPPHWGLGVGAPALLYDPASNTWSATDMPFQLLGGQIAATWTGRVIVVAAAVRGRVQTAAYDPATRRWRLISPVLPPNHPARYVTMLATPARLLLWSMWDRVRTFKHGFGDRAGVDVLAAGRDGTWRHVTGHWPQNEAVAAPLFTGSEILLPPATVWCGRRCSPPSGTGPGYFVNPATLTRTAIPPGPLAETEPVFVWTGRDIIAVNLYTEIGNPGHLIMREDDMALYNPAAGIWQRRPAAPGYPKLAVTPIWADRELFALAASGTLFAFHG
jgi:hypothetical protein